MSWISRIATKYPVLTASAQTGVLMIAGDLISQTAIEQKRFSQIDFSRTGRFALVGFTLMGPSLRVWYGILERRVVLSTPIKTALGRVTLDQLTFAPLCLFGFVSVMDALQGFKPEEIKQDLRNNYMDILMTNYKLWPAVQIFNFWLVPLQHRVLYVQFFAIIWNTYLSWKTNQSDRLAMVE